MHLHFISLHVGQFRGRLAQIWCLQIVGLRMAIFAMYTSNVTHQACWILVHRLIPPIHTCILGLINFLYNMLRHS